MSRPTPIDAALKNALDRIVPEACATLFERVRPPLRRTMRVPDFSREDTVDANCGGLIAFDGTALTGSLLIVSSFDFFSACRPPEIAARALSVKSSADWILVRDWSMELANQLLGRIKNRLNAYGVALAVKSPTAVSGDALRVATRLRRDTPLVFESGARNVSIWFEAIARPDSPALAKGDPTGLAREGDVILF